jgi:hypothetical protein
MPQDSSDVLSSVKSIGEYFRVDKSKSSLCFLLTDRQQLNGFKEIVAEPVVELPFYAFDFILALLGKRNRQIRPDNLPPIPQDVIQKEIQHVCHNVHHPEWQERKDIAQTITADGKK